MLLTPCCTAATATPAYRIASIHQPTHLPRRAEGYRVILLNSNPATIMTDPGTADRTYVGPMTPELVEQILEKVRVVGVTPVPGLG